MLSWSHVASSSPLAARSRCCPANCPARAQGSPAVCSSTTTAQQRGMAQQAIRLCPLEHGRAALGLPVTRRLPPPLLSSAERSPFADLRRRRASRAARAWDHPWHRPDNFTLHFDGSSRTATDGFRWSRRCWRLRHATNVLVYLWNPRHTAHSRGDGPSATDVPAQLPCGNCQPS